MLIRFLSIAISLGFTAAPDLDIPEFLARNSVSHRQRPICKGYGVLTELGVREGAVRARTDRRNPSLSEAGRPTWLLSICHAPSRCKHWFMLRSAES